LHEFHFAGSIDLRRKRLLEALFELISSEASYLKSLNVLISHFVQAPKLVAADPGVISKRDHRILFADAASVRHCSERFLADLEQRWQVRSGARMKISNRCRDSGKIHVLARFFLEHNHILWSHTIHLPHIVRVRLPNGFRLLQASVTMEGLCRVVKEHAEKNFGVYVRYCSNQVHQDKTLKRLR